MYEMERKKGGVILTSPVILSKVTNQDGTLWEVSGSKDTTHIVACDFDGWMCTCEDHYYRHRFCKHMKVCAESENITHQRLFVEEVKHEC